MKNILYVVDSGNNSIRAIDISIKIGGARVSTIAGNTDGGFVDGIGASAYFFNPKGITINTARNMLYVADTFNNAIRAINTSTYMVTTLTDSLGVKLNLTSPNAVAIDTDSRILYISDFTSIYSFNLSSRKYIRLVSGINNPSDLSLDTSFGVLYISEAKKNRITAINLNTNPVTYIVIAGSGNAAYTNDTGTDAEFNNPQGIYLNKETYVLYVMDTNNRVIRTVQLPKPTYSIVKIIEQLVHLDSFNGRLVEIPIPIVEYEQMELVLR